MLGFAEGGVWCLSIPQQPLHRLTLIIGMFPGINLYLSMFSRRDELQLRIAMFYSAASLSGAFSDLLAAAISKMDGIGGLQGWQ